MTDGTEETGKIAQRWTVSTVYADMWVNPSDDPRFTGIEPSDERSTLVDYLRGYRLTMEMKCADLDADQMATRSVPPSTMSLLGLVRHMAKVERYWFRQMMAAEDVPGLYESADDKDADWNGAVADEEVVEDAWRSWREGVEFAERYVEQTPDMGTTGTTRHGEIVQLRSVLVHMIEEYARHCGHADLLRERVDGRVGQ
jgi:uncharacterized damage-inducible protein DinB